MNKEPTIHLDLERKAYKLMNDADNGTRNELQAIIDQRIPETITSLELAKAVRRRLEQIEKLIHTKCQ